MHHSRRQFQPGFTLIEIITVLFVVSLGLLGVLSLIVQNIQVQAVNKNNMISYQLAQEGIELIRRVRDTNWRQGRDWDYGLSEGNPSEGFYMMDYKDDFPAFVNDSELQWLYLDNQGFYEHPAVPPGFIDWNGFQRMITITALDAHSLHVISQVQWYNHGNPMMYEVETVLYDWY